jgi:hypothetical protein
MTRQMRTTRRLGLMIPLLCGAALAACGDQQPVAPRLPQAAGTELQRLDCTASVTSGTVSCVSPATGGRAVRLGTGQIKMASSNLTSDTINGIFEFDATVQNLMNEAIGTPDGVTADPDGIQIFFLSGPTVTGGSGTVSVSNADGTGTFTAANQPYFAYHQILTTNQVSSAKRWQFQFSSGVTSFSFTVQAETDVQYLLVINEVLANPGGTISDANGEWFEIYNAGSRAVNLQNLLIADSAAAGRQPYHLITASISVPAVGYAVLGNTTDTTMSGGALVDYAYGSALQLANSLDAIKISRVYGTDTLTVDRAVYANASISAKNGISRELINPSLDNSNIDGSNWADASTTAVYGSAGRGTPKAQNSAFVP